MLRMVFDLPDFECTFPAPPATSVVGAYVALRCLVRAAQAPARRSRACARANSCWYGQAEAIATWIRRTLIFTSAPILSSFSRMLPQLARANWVKASPMRRSTEQHVGKRGEPQAQLIGPHGRRRGAISEQVQLAFLDPVLHLAAGTVDPLIQPPGVDLSGRQ